jgi:hypothetical protein
MSSGNSTNWRSLLDDKKARFQACGCEIPLIPAEPRFVVAFEALCREQRQLYYTRLLGGLKLNKTAAFARAVDKGCQHAHPNTVSALVYGATFIVVKVLSGMVGCSICLLTGLKRLWRAGCKPQELVKMLADLHSSFPPIDADSVRLLHEYEPFNALLLLFSLYCDALILSVAHISSNAGRMFSILPQH